MSSTVTDADWLRYAAALGWRAAGMAAGVLEAAAGIFEAAAGADGGLLASASVMEAAANEIGTLMTRSGGVEWYDAGWPVATVVDFEDCPCAWVCIWHPDATHERNRYDPELALLPCPNGGVHRLIAVLPGLVESVHEPEVPGAR